jgi:probable phosphoglycerate mutase
VLNHASDWSALPLSKRSLARPLTINIDGACSGNPGPAAAAAVCDDGRVPVSVFIGEATNNVAEYRALALALDVAEAEHPRAVVVRSDSELVVRQVNGQYKARDHLAAPCAAARARIAAHGNVTVEWVRRAHNDAADQAATTALAEGRRAPRESWPTEHAPTAESDQLW